MPRATPAGGAVRLESIRIDGFGCFDRRADFEFAPEGITLFLGPNESGKSTLMEALFGILFGFRSPEIERLHAPWAAGSAFGGLVVFEAGGKRYSLHRDFPTQRVKLIRIADASGGAPGEVLWDGDANPRGRTDDTKRFASLLDDLLGLADGALAKRTIHVSQDGMETSLDASVRERVTGAGKGDYTRAVGVLEEQHFEITAENPWSARRKEKPRDLELLEAEIGALRSSEASLLGALRELAACEERIRTAGGTLGEETKALARDRAALEAYSRFALLSGRRQETRQALDVLTRERETIRTAAKELADAEAALAPTVAIFGAASGVGEKLRELLSQGRAMSAEVERIADLRAAPIGAAPRAFHAVRATIVILLLLAAGTWFGWRAGFLGVGLVAGAALATVYLFLEMSLAHRVNETRARKLAEVGIKEEDLAAMRATAEGIRNELGGILSGRTPEEALRLWTSHREAIERRDRSRMVVERLRPAMKVEEDHVAKAGSVATLEAELRRLREEAPYLPAEDDARPAADEINRIRQEVARREKELEKLRKEHDEARFAEARVRPEKDVDLDRLREDVEERLERRARLLERRDALRLAIETLREAGREYESEHAGRLGDRISELFGGLTGGRLAQVTLAEGMEPRVARDGREIPIASLSAGTRDQLHFAIRAAVVEEISGDRPLPLFLDDPFVHFDSERLAAARAFLDALGASGRQTILFSHSAAYVPWAAKVNPLSGPGAMPSGAPFHSRSRNRTSSSTA